MLPADSPSFDYLLDPAANIGAFGILLIIAIFLIRNLPKWIDRHFVMINDLSTNHYREAKEAQDAFATQLKAERDQCDRYYQQIALNIESSNALNTRALENISHRITEIHALLASQKTIIHCQKDSP